MEKVATPVLPVEKHWQARKSRKEMHAIKNRYLNSIAYVDSLMKQMLDSLKEKGLYEKTLIVITGDHGEEFLDEGKKIPVPDHLDLDTFLHQEFNQDLDNLFKDT